MFFNYNFLDIISLIYLLIFFFLILGLLVSKGNLLVVFVIFELILLNLNVLFGIQSFAWDNLDGYIYILFNLTIASADAAVGLAIIIQTYKQIFTLSADKISSLKN